MPISMSLKSLNIIKEYKYHLKYTMMRMNKSIKRKCNSATKQVLSKRKIEDKKFNIGCFQGFCLDRISKSHKRRKKENVFIYVWL